MSEGKEALRTSVPLVLSSSYPILSFSLHLLHKSSYEPLIPSRVYILRLRRPPFARAWVCTCAYAYNVRVARPWKRHTPLPLLGHLPSPSSPVGHEDDSFGRSNASNGFVRRFGTSLRRKLLRFLGKKTSKTLIIDYIINITMTNN